MTMEATHLGHPFRSFYIKKINSIPPIEMSNNATAFKENLRTLEKEVLKGDLDSFDQWIV